MGTPRNEKDQGNCANSSCNANHTQETLHDSILFLVPVKGERGKRIKATVLTAQCMNSYRRPHVHRHEAQTNQPLKAAKTAETNARKRVCVEKLAHGKAVKMETGVDVRVTFVRIQCL